MNNLLIVYKRGSKLHHITPMGLYAYIDLDGGDESRIEGEVLIDLSGTLLTDWSYTHKGHHDSQTRHKFGQWVLIGHKCQLTVINTHALVKADSFAKFLNSIPPL